jgi:hypothetical protein
MTGEDVFNKISQKYLDMQTSLINSPDPFFEFTDSGLLYLIFVFPLMKDMFNRPCASIAVAILPSEIQSHPEYINLKEAFTRFLEYNTKNQSSPDNYLQSFEFNINDFSQSQYDKFINLYTGKSYTINEDQNLKNIDSSKMSRSNFKILYIFTMTIIVFVLLIIILFNRTGNNNIDNDKISSPVENPNGTQPVINLDMYGQMKLLVLLDDKYDEFLKSQNNITKKSEFFNNWNSFAIDTKEISNYRPNNKYIEKFFMIISKDNIESDENMKISNILSKKLKSNQFDSGEIAFDCLAKLFNEYSINDFNSENYHSRFINLKTLIFNQIDLIIKDYLFSNGDISSGSKTDKAIKKLFVLYKYSKN